MAKKITLSTFRRYTSAENMMIAAAMPRTAAASEPLPQYKVATVTVAERNGLRLVKPLTATMAEVANA